MLFNCLNHPLQFVFFECLKIGAVWQRSEIHLALGDVLILSTEQGILQLVINLFESLAACYVLERPLQSSSSKERLGRFFWRFAFNSGLSWIVGGLILALVMTDTDATDTTTTSAVAVQAVSQVFCHFFGRWAGRKFKL